jgi:hypothetical protein
LKLKFQTETRILNLDDLAFSQGRSELTSAHKHALPALRELDGDVLLKVRAAPGASREGVKGLHGEALKVAVAAPPERGKANEAIARLLAAHLSLRPSQIKIHSGEASRDKWFRLEGVTLKRLQSSLGVDDAK